MATASKGGKKKSQAAVVRDRGPVTDCLVPLPDGRTVRFFVNKETGLIVVDVEDARGRGGMEVFRKKV